MSKRSGGHYVKMVHNGIEYGMMELIAETYEYMRRALGWGNERIADAFDRWNDGKLHSYLIEITAKVFRTGDPLDSGDRKSTRLNSSHVAISYAVFCLTKRRNDVST